MKNISARRHVHGVTLLELMIAVAIVGLLSSAVFRFSVQLEEKSKEQQAIADIKAIESEIGLFYIANGRYPDTLAEIGAVKVDPWGNPYHYLNVTPVKKGKGKGGGKEAPPNGARKDKSLHPVNTDFDLYSAGEDGKTNAPLTAKSSRDDIIRGANGAYYGLAELF